MDAQRVIGLAGRLPWHLSADLRYFRRVTLSKPLLMGRGTYEAIGRPLPGRHNVVVTRSLQYTAPGCTVVHSLEAGLQAAGEVKEVMVIGGALIFQQLLPRVQRIYLTEIHATFLGDTWFPEFSSENWIEVWRENHDPDSQNLYPYSFVRLERRDIAAPR